MFSTRNAHFTTFYIHANAIVVAVNMIITSPYDSYKFILCCVVLQ